MTDDAAAAVPATGFDSLNLPEPLLRALREVGYETPSPIQAQCIPHMLAGRDLLGQAQTGTGKTAAFALPILARIELGRGKPQALVLTPTRELGIQVAEAFQRYAMYMPGFHVLPIYGGQSYGPQISALQRGVHVVVGTPGRIIDHLERGSLDISQIRHVVLDEADEMLRMGFIDDVETILSKTPATRQTALFSATLPAPIRRIAQVHQKQPVEVTISAKTRTAENIRHRFLQVSNFHKLDALTRILEAEPFEAMIVFVRTRQSTDELAGKLQARGFSAAAISGELAQAQRERTIGMLREGAIDILVATDVAARGLDVDRVSHVLNYDVPSDPEAYVHRIGRTGRAGRSGEAILFITPRERTLLRIIERATRQPIAPMDLPTVQAVNDVRVGKFKQQILDTIAAGGLAVFQGIIEQIEREQNVTAIDIAAALAKLARGDVPLLLEPPPRPPPSERFNNPDNINNNKSNDNSDEERRPARPFRPRDERPLTPGMAAFRVEVGAAHGVRPGNLVGAIANETGLTNKQIGRIEIFNEYSFIDLPEDLGPDVLQHISTVWCGGQQLQISRAGETPDRSGNQLAGKRGKARMRFFTGKAPHRKA